MRVSVIIPVLNEASTIGDTLRAVVELGAEYKLLAVNRVSSVSDESIFNSTPAISDGALFLRSSSTLYCISTE